jgi:hypothetical protein
MRFCPAKRAPTANSLDQIQLNEIFAIESIVERVFADVKSITGGWIEDETVNRFLSRRNMSLK